MTCVGRLALAGLVCLIAASALAQSAGGDFSLPKAVVAGGSALLEGGDFRVQGTLGQAEPGSQSGGDFAVLGGFWPDADSVPPPTDGIFGNGFEP